MSKKELTPEIVTGLWVERTVFVRNELGLHARPAAKLAQAARSFEAGIRLTYDEMTVDAKSILDILSLAAGRGAEITVRCEGVDADRAMAAMEVFFAEEADANYERSD
ncbi:MAG: HPr family phosphocarrier protein [Desulfovibrio sp.]|nr:HPr family phosphocarrier protein [Desulfovibrio sp.]